MRGSLYLDESVHSQDNQLWLRLRIVHEVQIYKLLLLQIIRLHVLQHIWEEAAHVWWGVERVACRLALALARGVGNENEDETSGRWVE